MAAAELPIPFDMAPFRLSGIVYGTLLNHATALAELGARASLPPYGAAPRAPVLFIKPRNTLAVNGERIDIPAGIDALEVGACLGMVIGRTACRLAQGEALEHLAGFLLVNDVSIPHDTFYRPSIRLKARDGFCPLGTVVARESVGDPDDLNIRTYVDDVLVQTQSTATVVRGVARLLADVTEFMTLSPGDVLTFGAARPAPLVRAGQTVRIEADGIGSLSNPFRTRAS